MNLKTEETKQSKIDPAVSYTIRLLNMIQRAQRDAPVADKMIEYTRLTTHLVRIRKQNSIEKENVDGADIPKELFDEMIALTHHSNLIYAEHIIPSKIRAGLVAVHGISTGDGKPIDVEQFISYAPTELLTEASALCDAASGLTEEQQKN